MRLMYRLRNVGPFVTIEFLAVWGLAALIIDLV